MNNELDKKVLKQDYKNEPPKAGVYLIANKINGRKLIATAQNAQGVLNRHLFELKFKQHRNKQLLEDWAQFGESAFEFMVLETVKPDEKNIKNALENLLIKHIEQQELNDATAY